MGIIAILSFFIILSGAVLVLGGFASSVLGALALVVGLGIAIVAIVGMYNFIKHDEMPDSFQPRHHDPHAR
jgi:hypothetical protein